MIEKLLSVFKKEEQFKEYRLGISRKHAGVDDIRLEVMRQVEKSDFGDHAMDMRYAEFWANEKQLVKVKAVLSKYKNLDYTLEEL